MDAKNRQNYLFFEDIYLFSRDLHRSLVDLHLELLYLEALQLGPLRLQLLLERRVSNVRRVDVDVGRRHGHRLRDGGLSRPPLNGPLPVKRPLDLDVEALEDTGVEEGVPRVPELVERHADVRVFDCLEDGSEGGHEVGLEHDAVGVAMVLDDGIEEVEGRHLVLLADLRRMNKIKREITFKLKSVMTL